MAINSRTDQGGRNGANKMRVKYLSVKVRDLSNFPNFHYTGSVSGMKKHFYGQDALLVRSGSYIYNVSKEPGIYWILAK